MTGKSKSNASKPAVVVQVKTERAPSRRAGKEWVLRKPRNPPTHPDVQRKRKPPRKQSVARLTSTARRSGARLASTSGAVGSVKELLYNLISPCDAHGFRWPYEGSSSSAVAVRTGAANLHQVSSLTPSSGFAGTYTGHAGTALFYQFRTPLRAMVILNTLASDATYNATFTNGATTWTPAIELNLPVPIGFLSAASSALVPHGSYLYTGGLDSRPDMAYVWCGYGDKITVTSTSSGTPAAYWHAYKVKNPGAINGEDEALLGTYGTTAITSATTTTVLEITDVANIGYYGFKVDTGAVATTYSLKLIVKSGDVLSHVSVPGAQEHAIYFRSVRLLASSMLLTNVASQLNVEGSIYGGLVTDGSVFHTFNTPKVLTESLTDYYDGPNGKGLYSWLKPTVNAFNYRQCLWTTNGSVTNSCFSLDDGSGFQVAIIKSIGQTPTSYPALDFLLTFHYALEFHSDDPWRELEYSPYDPLDAVRVQAVACRMATFTHNPIHLAQIKQFVGKATSLLRRHSALIGNTLATMFPEFSVPLIAGGNFFQSRG